MIKKQPETDIFHLLDCDEYVRGIEEANNKELMGGNVDEYEEKYLMSKERYFSEENKLISKTTVIASFLPDLILKDPKNYDCQSFDGSVLCADVSGFTDLCEKYNEIGSGGLSGLTLLLNNFIGAMVQEIMSLGGDVIKFSGDAFLAFWKCTQIYPLRDAIQESINCALVIQKNHSNFLTDVGVVLRVKLAVSAGTMLFSLLGDSKFTHYIEVGQPILDAKEILDQCHAGEIIVSEKAFAYIGEMVYQNVDINDGQYVKVYGVGESWRQVQKLSYIEPASNYGMQKNADDVSSLSIMSQEIFIRKQDSNCLLRPDIHETVKNPNFFYGELKKFIIPPVMLRIDLNEPLEYLTEQREITVLMINIVTKFVTFHSFIFLVKKVYKIMIKHSQKFNGCINKVSCFDKDLMCVLIFGLRGSKQERECSNALRCASYIHEKVSCLTKVQDISIGISTGKAYCGVFGHTLRRDYTVIGIAVNKAARLMMVYPGKVTCCNNTFINSRIRKAYFELQEFVPLKGIKHPGPVYEFKYTYRDQKQLSFQIYPILGRDNEMVLYAEILELFLNKCTKRITQEEIEALVKMILVVGEMKSGKSRLLEEFMYITPIEIAIYTVLRDSIASQQNINNVFKKIFFPKMGLELEIKNLDDEHKVHEVIQKYLPKLSKTTLCYLNDIFDTDFPCSSRYSKGTDEYRISITGRILQILTIKIFRTPTLILIERMIIQDEQTWKLFPYLLNVKHILIVASMRTNNVTESMKTWLQESRQVELIELSNIDKIYQSALACQMMEVEAIPPDLENIIQRESNGNPGWIENFLTSLQDAKAVNIKPLTYDKIHLNGLLCPPLYMMRRLTHKQFIIWRRFMEEKSGKRYPLTYDSWFKYLDCCRDEFTNVKVRAKMNQLFALDCQIKACLLSDKFKEVYTFNQASRETTIIRKFDSLLYTEQLIVKCGSVLGWQFTRAMLEYVVGSSLTTRQIAEAIKKLFEYRIFGCSMGDFTQPGDYLLKIGQKKDYDNQPIQCYCIGLYIPGSCRDLPKYASCGYLHFISNTFLDATYNLLTNTQKVEFHQRAAKYLEENTKKCRACGSSFFGEIIDDKESFILGDSRRKTIHSQFLYETQEPPDFTYLTSNKKDVHMKSIVIKPEVLEKFEQTIVIVPTYAGYNFTHCKCKLILNYKYGEVSRHYKVSGQYDLMLRSMLLFVKSCLDLDNIAKAFITLEDAENHLKTKGIGLGKPQWKLDILRGNILALRGKALIQTSQIDEAKKCLYKALKKYGRPFPKTNFRKYLKMNYLILRQKYTFDKISKTLKMHEIVYYNDLAECLLYLSDVFLGKKLYKEEELAAIWALNCAVKANYEFKLICQCFARVNLLAQRKCDTYHCIVLENYAIRYCQKSNITESDELKYVAELYNSIRRFRNIRAEFTRSFTMGNMALNIATSVKDKYLIVLIILSLIITCALTLNLDDFIKYLNILDFHTSGYQSDPSILYARFWLYSSSLRLLIETGYTYFTYSFCESFHDSQNLYIDDDVIKDGGIRMEFIIFLWLWNCRNSRWAIAKNWDYKIVTYVNYLVKNNRYLPIEILYVLEGYLLRFAFAIDNENLTIRNLEEKKIKKIIKHLEYNTRYASFGIPRLTRLKAYYYYLKGDEMKGFKMLKKTREISMKCGNKLEIVQVDHTKNIWNDDITKEEKDKWINNCNSTNLVYYPGISGDKIACFSFPVPKYV